MHLIAGASISKAFSVLSGPSEKQSVFRRLFRPGYERLTAVDDVSFTVTEGESVAYLGPNGAGKSTMLKMICGVLVPTSGDLRVMGMTPWKDRSKLARHLGVVFGQRTQLLWDLAVVESFRFLATMYGLGRDEYRQNLSFLVARFGIDQLMHRPVRELSLGQRTRVEIAAALLHRPKIIILDEPTIGMDLLVKDQIREALAAIRREFGASLILASHDLSDVEALCDRALLVVSGRLKFDGTLAELKNAAQGRRTVEFTLRSRFVPTSVVDLGLPSDMSLEASGGRVRLTYSSERIPTVDVVSSVLRHVEITDIAIMGPSLEDVVRSLYSGGEWPDAS